MNIIIYLLVILVILYFLLRWWSNISPKKMSKGVRLITILLLALLAVLFAIGGKFLLTLPLTLASLALVKLKGLSLIQLLSLYRLIQTLRNSGRFSFNQYQNNNSSSLSISDAYKILSSILKPSQDTSLIMELTYSSFSFNGLVSSKRKLQTPLYFCAIP